MNKPIFLFIACIFFGNSLNAQNIPRSYIAYRSSESILIDGRAEESSWQKASFSEDFIDIEGVKKPKYQTNVKMLWDDNYLYFYARIQEPHIWATLKQRDTVIFYNNDFEIFIDPDGDTYNYMEFEMNALNTVWDLFLVKPYREPAPVIDAWDFKGLKSNVHIEGTLNDPSDTDKNWSVEVAIPWEVMEEANVFGNGHEHSFWRINFSRVNWDYQLDEKTYSRRKNENGDYLPEYNWVWSPQGVINMHEPEHWGYVYFSSKEVGEKDVFEIPRDEKVKWILYELYRTSRNFQKDSPDKIKSLEKLIVKPVNIGDFQLTPEFEEHVSGWNISLESPFSKIKYSINEEGKIIKL
ncbi:carbohydrate-binding family 9-like protein [Pontixanthobacter gangjinensis]|uniref:Carbohydrate-binding family 9-like protein n=1 Tax=Christiangramia aestuarii TaxID=1028746 RepID=A0A7K1LRG2_9FLAO|nr:carbohydrate-binding family 9-like protein [Christiangramia aestuarii]MUP43392.1 carbohydrate-binding family 9-like protein [Christiangramia aestuarii]